MQIVKVQKGKQIKTNIGCCYNGVCSSLAALFLLQQVTHLATVMAHCGILSIYQFIKIGFVSKFFVDLCNLREICVTNMVTIV